MYCLGLLLELLGVRVAFLQTECWGVFRIGHIRVR